MHGAARGRLVRGGAGGTIRLNGRSATAKLGKGNPVRLDLFIGLRFLGAARQHRTVSIITWFSLLGVMLGVTALIITVSVMNGFRANMFIAVTGTLPHLRALPEQGELTGEAFREVAQRLAGRPDVEAVAPFLSRQAFIAVDGNYRAVLLRGIDPAAELRTTELALFLRGPDLPVVEPSAAAGPEAWAMLQRIAYPPPPGRRAGILLGASLARALGLLVGDEVRIVSTVQRITPIGPVPLMKQFRLVGVFETGLSGRDELFAYVDHRIASRLFGLRDAVDGIALRVADPQAMDLAGLRALLPGYRWVQWSDENKNVFQVMRLEKLGVFLILSLIVLVSFFNIIGSLIIMVVEKRKVISILKSMGASDNLVRRIFFLQGVSIGAVGTVGGLLLGLAGSWLLGTFDLIHIPPGVYPVSDRLPVVVEWLDVLLITASSFLICVVVTLYPATRAARTDPVENLRFQ
ncbi:MAG: ABC transporter permease [SAR324 cluster bacterium]|nr:ABC transporter permease [SAR324 cluster bacterium]